VATSSPTRQAVVYDLLLKTAAEILITIAAGSPAAAGIAERHGRPAVPLKSAKSFFDSALPRSLTRRGRGADGGVA
jgi:hypothetical protein